MRKIAVIGLGNFGSYVSAKLYDKGYDVMAIDKDPALVQKIKDQVTQAVVADCTDRTAIESLGIGEMDVVIVGIGTNLAASILTTLNVKEMGVPRVLAKATSESHRRILTKLGVEECVFPEKDVALSLAERLHNPSMVDYLPFLEGYGIVEMKTPAAMVGRSLRDLDMINRFGIQIVAIKDGTDGSVNMVPTGQYCLTENDRLILIGSSQGVDKLKQQ